MAPEDSSNNRGTTSVEIKNLKDLAEITHKCISVDKLTEIQISLARVEESSISQAAAFQELNARFEEQSRQIQQVLYSRHECYQINEIKRLGLEVEFLKEEHHKRVGESKWDDRVWAIVQALFIVIAGAIVLWFLKGGSIA